MSDRVGIGIVGVGFGAGVQLPALEALPAGRVVAIADGGSGRAEELARRSGARIRASPWQELVAASDVDLVSVATPPRAQAEVTIAALGWRKHVLCEKPFGANVDDALAMCAAASTAARVGAVNFEFRFEPAMRELRRLVARGDLGRIERFDVSWTTSGGADPSRPWSWRDDAAQGGGALNALGSHVIDYVQWISGKTISSISATSRVLVASRTDPNGASRPVTAENRSALTCELEGGGAASITVSNAGPGAGSHRVEVTGDRGRATFIHDAPFTAQTQSLTVETAMDRTVVPLTWAADGDTRVLSVRELARRLLLVIAGGMDEDLPDLASGLRTQRALDAARRSIASGSPADVDR